MPWSFMELENYIESDEYQELAEEVIDEHEELHWLKCADVRIDYISSVKKRKSKGKPVLGECQLVKEIYKLYCPYDFLIIIYEPNIEGLSLNQIKILLYHELLHVGVSEISGEPQYSINPHEVEDFRAIINKYGVDWADNG